MCHTCVSSADYPDSVFQIRARGVDTRGTRFPCVGPQGWVDVLVTTSAVNGFLATPSAATSTPQKRRCAPAQTGAVFFLITVPRRLSGVDHSERFVLVTTAQARPNLPKKYARFPFRAWADCGKDQGFVFEGNSVQSCRRTEIPPRYPDARVEPDRDADIFRMVSDGAGHFTGSRVPLGNRQVTHHTGIS